MLRISYIPKKLHLAERFVQKSDHSKYYNILNSKLPYRYISAGFPVFSEHSCQNHLQEHSLLMSNSEHMLELVSAIFQQIFIFHQMIDLQQL